MSSTGSNPAAAASAAAPPASAGAASTAGASGAAPATAPAASSGKRSLATRARAALPKEPDTAAHHGSKLQAEGRSRLASEQVYSYTLATHEFVLPSFIAAARESTTACAPRGLTLTWLTTVEGERTDALALRAGQPLHGRPKGLSAADEERLSGYVGALDGLLGMVREASRADLPRYALPGFHDGMSPRSALLHFQKFLEGAETDITAIAAGVATPTAFQKAGLTADDVQNIETARDAITAMIQTQTETTSGQQEDGARLQILHHALDHALDRLKAVLREALKPQPEKKKALFKLLERRRDRREPAAPAPGATGANAASAAQAAAASGPGSAGQTSAPPTRRAAGHGHGRAAADAVAPDGIAEPDGGSAGAAPGAPAAPA